MHSNVIVILLIAANLTIEIDKAGFWCVHFECVYQL